MDNKFAYNVLELHITLISKIVQLTNCQLYLELGVSKGTSLEEVYKYCKNCIGVDVQDISDFRDFKFYLTTTDEFFKNFNEKPDIIFIDADHHFEQVKKDFINSLNCLSEHGIIFLHDTDPYRDSHLSFDFCGDSYKMHDWVKENYPDLNIVTLPIGVAGLTIINRDKDRRVLKFL